MDVVIKRSDDEDTWRSSLAIMIDGEEVFSVRDDEPEDSNLGRSFSDCYKIEGLLHKAYLAGKNGETLSISTIQIQS